MEIHCSCGAFIPNWSKKCLNCNIEYIKCDGCGNKYPRKLLHFLEDELKIYCHKCYQEFFEKG